MRSVCTTSWFTIVVSVLDFLSVSSVQGAETSRKSSRRSSRHTARDRNPDAFASAEGSAVAAKYAAPPKSKSKSAADDQHADARVDIEAAFAPQLSELEGLGFTDRARNIAALKQTKGLFSCVFSAFFDSKPLFVRFQI